MEPKWLLFGGDPSCEHVFTECPPRMCVKCMARKEPDCLEAKSWWPRENPTNEDILKAFEAGCEYQKKYAEVDSEFPQEPATAEINIGMNGGMNGDILFRARGPEGHPAGGDLARVSSGDRPG